MKKGKVQDFYFHKAKREKYSARSVYKLKNIQEKYHLISKGNRVLDLGASPGSWSEYIVGLIGRTGELWALDEKPLSLTAQQKIKATGCGFRFLKQSVFEEISAEWPSLDLVVSDMAPFTQGNRTVDCSRSLELITRAHEIAVKALKKGGHFVTKLFHSPETVAMAKSWEKEFKFAKLYKPPAVQKDSKEIYFVGQHFRIDLESTKK